MRHFYSMFMNDVTQGGGEGGWHFCDTMYEGISKTGNLISVTEGEEGSENLQICMTSFMDDPWTHEFCYALSVR